MLRSGKAPLRFGATAAAWHRSTSNMARNVWIRFSDNLDCTNMSEKRKPTTRYQGERPPKRRQFSPPPPLPLAHKHLAQKESVNLTKEDVSGRSKESQSLPIQNEKQDTSLSDEHYQTIAERLVDCPSAVGSNQLTLSVVFWRPPYSSHGRNGLRMVFLNDIGHVRLEKRAKQSLRILLRRLWPSSVPVL